MTNQDRQNAALPQGDRVVPLRRPARLSAIDGGERPRGEGPLYRSRRFFGRHRRFLRRSGIGIGVAVALVNLMREQNGVRAGQFVTCGSWTGLRFLKPGDTCGVRFEGLGEAEVTFTG